MDVRQVFAESPQVAVECAAPGWTRLRVPPTTEARGKVVDFVREEMTALPGDLGEQLTLAADELLRNSIEHGCRDGNPCNVDFTLIRTARMILFHVRDEGPGFSLHSIAHAAINNPPQQPLRHTEYRNEMGLRPGGFGILLVKQIADELIYSEAGNEVVMIKYLGDESHASAP